MNTAEPITHTHAHTHTDKRAQLIPTTNARERTLLTTFTAWNNQQIGMTLGTRKKNTGDASLGIGVKSILVTKKTCPETRAE